MLYWVMACVEFLWNGVSWAVTVVQYAFGGQFLLAAVFWVMLSVGLCCVSNSVGV